ncbi:MAG: hypothetical protein H5T42_01810 [Methanothrix sp.]|jgi:hypothetical protein|uniref:SWIM-type domain-containing protein n=1 Tax=Methanothrix thermoacetophila (strain DSM 6194 / JCM 14653 / NBRC 101360 / PT) TaxID=349307 RepID=A0B940_METTP|nr:MULTISPECIES: hypothetical protein [Methanothrix]ABK15214.1 hypothetical protein Mthe_1440 [Methanothrix thermoacetophila PT]MBC7079201.1 hypothetical protein [Methanothrix sp.]NPU86665.1 hypothetical protein [Methanothrix sp.]
MLTSGFSGTKEDEWLEVLSEIEEIARSSESSVAAHALLHRVEALAKREDVPPELEDRLDMLLIELTEAARDACTNTKCPHYGKRCKMR